MNTLRTGTEITQDLADFVVDYWKIARGLEKTATLLQKMESKRLLSQVKYANRQLSAYADRFGFRIVEFDGLDFEPGMAASADNFDDFEHEAVLVVTKTIEPAIVREMSVVRQGRVIVAQKTL